MGNLAVTPSRGGHEFSLDLPLSRRNLAEVAAYLGPIYPASGEWAKVSVTDITSDSHSVTPGSLFVALPGIRRHGASYALDAIKAGAVAIVTDQAGDSMISDRSIPIITVSRPEVDLGHLAHWFYDNPMTKMYAAGITGTNGKTTTTTLLYEIWQEAGFAAGLLGTIATRMPGIEIPAIRTTPSADSIARSAAQMAELHVRALAMEVSSHGLALHRVNGARFAAVGFTNLSQDHLDFHGTMESYFQAKSKLFSHEFAERAFINIDDEYGARLAESAEIEVSTLSLSDRRATWHLIDYHRTRVGYQIQVRGPEGILVESEIGIRGRHNLENYLMALAFGYDSGVDSLLLERISPVLRGAPGRLERVDLGQDFEAFVDYAHSPEAVEKVIATLRESTESKLISVIGCGGDRDKSKRPLMAKASVEGADISIFTSDNPRSEDPETIINEMTSGLTLSAAVIVEIDRAEAIAKAVAMADKGDCVVVLGKGHEQGQAFKDRTEPFDDRIELAKAIESLASIRNRKSGKS